MVQPRLESTETLKVMKEQIAAEDETPDNRYHLEEYFEKKVGINADCVIDPDADSAAALAATASTLILNYEKISRALFE